MVVCVPVAGLYRDRACRALYSERLFGESVEALCTFDDGVLLLCADGVMCFGKAEEFDKEPENGVRMRSLFGADLLRSPCLQSEKILLAPRFSYLWVTKRTESFAHLALPGGKQAYCLKNTLSPLPEKGAHTTDRAVSDALDLLGTPYRWGGRSPWGIDCSGLVSLCYRAYGLPQDTRILKTLPRVGRDAACRGDLVLFPGHVGLYLGRGLFIHASCAHACVTISSLDPANELYDPTHVKDGYFFCRPVPFGAV